MPKLKPLFHTSLGCDGPQYLQRILGFRFGLIFGAPFARLWNSFDIIFINSHHASSNDAFDEIIIVSYVVKHLFCDLYSTSCLQKFRSFVTNLARFIPETLTKICRINSLEILRSSASSRLPTRRFTTSVILTLSFLSSFPAVARSTPFRAHFKSTSPA